MSQVQTQTETVAPPSDPPVVTGHPAEPSNTVPAPQAPPFPTYPPVFPATTNPAPAMSPSLVDLKGLVAAFKGAGIELPIGTLRKWAKSGQIPCLTYGGRRRLFSPEAVERALLSMAGNPPAPSAAAA